MRKIILLALLVLNLQADFSLDNEIEVQVGSYAKGIADNSNDVNSMVLFTYSPIMNYKSKNLDFNFIPMITHLHSETPVYNDITNEEYNSNDLFITSLYLKLHNQKHKLLLGVLAFSYNGYLGYKNDFHERGEGLHTIIDKDILAGMYIYKPNDNLELKALYGGSFYNDDTINLEVQETHLQKEVLLISNYSKDKFRLDFNLLLERTIKEDKKSTLAELGALGIGIVYDDSEYTGSVFYNILNFSYYDFKGTSIEDLMSHTGLSYSEIENNPMFSYESKITTGWANLLGYRKDIELFGCEFFINGEWFHSSDNYMSGNLGNIYKGDATDMYYVGNDSLSLTTGYNINEEQYVKMVYSHIILDKLPAMGNSSVKIDSQPGYTNSYTYAKILWNYKF